MALQNGYFFSKKRVFRNKKGGIKTRCTQFFGRFIPASFNIFTTLSEKRAKCFGINVLKKMKDKIVKRFLLSFRLLFWLSKCLQKCPKTDSI